MKFFKNLFLKIILFSVLLYVFNGCTFSKFDCFNIDGSNISSVPFCNQEIKSSNSGKDWFYYNVLSDNLFLTIRFASEPKKFISIRELNNSFNQTYIQNWSIINPSKLNFKTDNISINLTYSFDYPGFSKSYFYSNSYRSDQVLPLAKVNGIVYLRNKTIIINNSLGYFEHVSGEFNFPRWFWLWVPLNETTSYTYIYKLDSDFKRELFFEKKSDRVQLFNIHFKVSNKSLYLYRNNLQIGEIPIISESEASIYHTNLSEFKYENKSYPAVYEFFNLSLNNLK